MTRMVYSPEPKALARTVVPGTFSCFGSLRRLRQNSPSDATLRAQKAITPSMSRGFILPNLSFAQNLASAAPPPLRRPPPRRPPPLRR